MPRARLLTVLGCSTGAAARILRGLVDAGQVKVRGAPGALQYRWPVDCCVATSTDAHPTSPRGDTGAVDRPPPGYPPL